MVCTDEIVVLKDFSPEDQVYASYIGAAHSSTFFPCFFGWPAVDVPVGDRQLE